jgi:hypothetical protein
VKSHKKAGDKNSRPRNPNGRHLEINAEAQDEASDDHNEQGIGNEFIHSDCNDFCGHRRLCPSVD